MQGRNTYFRENNNYVSLQKTSSISQGGNLSIYTNHCFTQHAVGILLPSISSSLPLKASCYYTWKPPVSEFLLHVALCSRDVYETLRWKTASSQALMKTVVVSHRHWTKWAGKSIGEHRDGEQDDTHAKRARKPAAGKVLRLTLYVNPAYSKYSDMANKMMTYSECIFGGGTVQSAKCHCRRYSPLREIDRIASGSVFFNHGSLCNLCWFWSNLLVAV